MHVLLLLILQVNVVQGILWDNERSLPVSNAYIYPVGQPHLSVVSNEAGLFILPESISYKDSLEMSHISYEKKRFLCGSSSHLDTIFLQSRPFELDEVHVFGETALDIMKNCIRRLKANHSNSTQYFKFQTSIDRYDKQDVLQTIEDYNGVLKQNSNQDFSFFFQNSRYYIKQDKDFKPSDYLTSLFSIELDPILRLKDDHLKRLKLGKFDWQYIGQVEQFGRKVHIIGLQSKGEGYYDSGTLLIDEENYAVVKSSLYSKDKTLISEVLHVPYKDKMILKTVFDYNRFMTGRSKRISQYQIIEDPTEYINLKYMNSISGKKYIEVVENIQNVDSFDQKFLSRREEMFEQGRE